ncbi:MAG: glutamine-hydrolyzing carbamoyl-phosphate synthase small subunit [Planctomycetota bacterium]|nr:glutamine-hydrolyzing carbamoyl-phosphate synthase small subunit [Planctomycetota bacterium]
MPNSPNRPASGSAPSSPPASSAAAPLLATDSRPVARLALVDGSIFVGRGFGAVHRGIVSRAEVVFNTAHSGYQESLTDPSYTGQILVQTFPLIGNTGVNPEDVESVKVQVAGFVVRELARQHSNYRATQSLSDYLAASNVLGLEGIDTRALTKRLRSTGSMNGVLTDNNALTDADLVRLAREAPSMAGLNLVPLVGCSSQQSWSETLGEWLPAETSSLLGAGAGGVGEPPLRVLALDCGAKRNILRHLTSRNCSVRIVPHDISASEIRRLHESGEIDGLFISNGPGDPAAVESTIRTLREIVGAGTPGAAPPTMKAHLPTFGICLGHQLLALAVGAKTYKLKFGHRGINQPVLNRRRGRVEITSQNHGFAVEPESLASVGGQATHVHLNDGTVAGFAIPDRAVFSVQYHPEASPGPHDAGYLFDQFVDAMRAARAKRQVVASR